MNATNGNFISYLRVSTQQQGRSGLGLEAQRKAIQDYAATRGDVLQEFVEVETGKQNARPQLQAALKRCRVTGATLLIAKLDRLSRHAGFLMNLRDDKAKFVALDCPDANTLTIGVMAAMAQYERETISARTKAALAASKARGTKLGGYRANAPSVGAYQQQGAAAAAKKAAEHLATISDDLRQLRAAGLSCAKVAAALNAQSIWTSRSNPWTGEAVRRSLARLGL